MNTERLITVPDGPIEELAYRNAALFRLFQLERDALDKAKDEKLTTAQQVDILKLRRRLIIDQAVMANVIRPLQEGPKDE